MADLEIPLRDAPTAMARALGRPASTFQAILSADGTAVEVRLDGRRFRPHARLGDAGAAVLRWPATLAAAFPRCVLRQVQLTATENDPTTPDPTTPDPASPERDAAALARVARGVLRFALETGFGPVSVTASLIGVGTSALIAHGLTAGGSAEERVSMMPEDMTADLRSALGAVRALVGLDIPGTASASGRLALRRSLEEDAP